jgi:AcrR family transcriptional regulator
MSSSIGVRHIEATRSAILEAAGGLFLEHRVDGFSIQQVADRAGLTHRTVYRYFPTRKDLVRATVEHLAPGMADDSVIEASTVEEWIDGIAAHLARTEANFEVFRGLVVAAFASDELQRPDKRLRDRETRRWQVFRRQFPHLSERDARRTFAALRQLTSSVSYVLMRLRFGMSSAEATDAIRSGASQIVEQTAVRNRIADSKRRKRR